MDTWVTWPDYSYKIPITELIPKVRVQKNSCLIEVYTFQVIVRFLCSDNVSRRCSCSGTIGALSGVVLLFLNARPVVSDEPARSSAGQWKKKVDDRQKRPGLQTRTPKTNKYKIKPTYSSFLTIQFTYTSWYNPICFNLEIISVYSHTLYPWEQIYFRSLFLTTM